MRQQCFNRLPGSCQAKSCLVSGEEPEEVYTTHPAKLESLAMECMDKQIPFCLQFQTEHHIANFVVDHIPSVG